MSFSDTIEAALLALLYENANVANVGDATGLRGSSTAGSLYVTLHTADPGETGTQSTNEVSYTGMGGRVAVTRTAGAWDITGTSPTQVANAATITFGQRSDSGAAVVATHFSVGLLSSGAGAILHKGALNSPLSITQNITPSFAAGQLVGTLD